MRQAAAAWIVRAVIRAQNLFLTLVHQALFGRNRPAATAPRRILVFRIAALGDFIIAFPAMAALRDRFPEAHITLLTVSTTQPEMKSRVSRYGGALPSWLSLAVPTVTDEVLTWSGNSLREILAEVRPKVQTLDPDAAFVLVDVAAPLAGVCKKLVFLWLAGVRARVFGWRRRASRSVLWLGRAAEALSESHVAGLLRSVSEHPAFRVTGVIPVAFPLHVSEGAEEWARQAWATHGWTNLRVVALAPGSIQPHKRWPLGKFTELCAELCKDPGVHLVVLGTRDDMALGEHLKKDLSGRLTNLAGQTSIEQSAALLARCALLVGNDGGAMHLGAAAGCRVVSIVPGIQLPGTIEPWGNVDLAVRHPVPCAPCHSFTHCPEGHNKCMVDLPVERVLHNCLKVLDAGRAARR